MPFSKKEPQLDFVIDNTEHRVKSSASSLIWKSLSSLGESSDSFQ